jgi:hypothetical protein
MVFEQTKDQIPYKYCETCQQLSPVVLVSALEDTDIDVIQNANSLEVCFGCNRSFTKHTAGKAVYLDQREAELRGFLYPHNDKDN